MEVWAVKYGYHVLLGPRIHTVSVDGHCTCGNGACPAVPAVAVYISAGGEEAEPYPQDCWAAAPVTCPVCGSVTQLAPNARNSHGVVWDCLSGDLSHYWLSRLRAKHRLVTFREEVPGEVPHSCWPTEHLFGGER